MEFAGPSSYKSKTLKKYFLGKVDRLSCFPQAETFFNCDTETAIDYLERNSKLQCIQRAIRCYQAQAIKAKEIKKYFVETELLNFY